MTYDHNPAGCRQPACQRCDDYGQGYAAGKDKAAFEFQHHDITAHADDCACAPCTTWTQAAAGMKYDKLTYLGGDR